MHGDDTVQFRRSRPERGLGYLGYVAWSESTPPHVADPAGQRTDHYLLFGARTLAADLPRTGSGTYSGETSTYGGTQPVPSEERAATIVVDFAARTVSVTTFAQAGATGTAGSGDPPKTPIIMTGRFEATTGRISGTVTFGSGAPTGSFEGALYGPGGAELGLVFKAQVEGTLVYGFLTGRR